MNSETSIYCFCGPTIDPPTVTAILPQATVLPPVGHGDLLRLSLAQGDTVLIIDGYYFERFPLRHREILSALETGVTVLGAASIGALRAADLAPFGMRGIGSIFRLYRRGALVGDDEVAVLHATAEFGFAPQGEALVNIRASCRSAARAGVITPDEARIVVGTAQSRGFWERQYPSILDAAVRSGLSEEAAERFTENLASFRRDLKREDALRALRLLATHGPSQRKALLVQPAPRATIDLHRWREETPRFPVGDTSLPETTVLSAAQVLSADYPELHYRIALECLAIDGSSARGNKGEENQVIQQLQRDDVNFDPALHDWVSQRGLRIDEIRATLIRRSTIAALLGHDRPPGIDELEDLTTSAARRQGWLPAITPHIANQGWLSTKELDTLTETKQCARILTRAFQLHFTTPVRAPFVTALKLYGDFIGAAERARMAATLNEAHVSRRPDLSLEQLSAGVVFKWFSDRWNNPQNDFIGCAERGLPTRQIALPVLRHFYLLDRTNVSQPQWFLLSSTSREFLEKLRLADTDARIENRV